MYCKKVWNYSNLDYLAIQQFQFLLYKIQRFHPPIFSYICCVSQHLYIYSIPKGKQINKQTFKSIDKQNREFRIRKFFRKTMHNFTNNIRYSRDNSKREKFIERVIHRWDFAVRFPRRIRESYGRAARQR